MAASRCDERTILAIDLEASKLDTAGTVRRFALWYERHRQSFQIVYLSRSTYAEVQERLATDSRFNQLPAPTAIVSEAGTQLRQFPDGTPIGDWNNRVHATWDPGAVTEYLRRHSELMPTAARGTSVRRVCYYLCREPITHVVRMRQALKLDRVDAWLCTGPSATVDVVPTSATMGQALRYLLRTMGLNQSRAIVCGHPGHEPSCFNQGFRGVALLDEASDWGHLMNDQSTYQANVRTDELVPGIEFWRKTLEQQQLAARIKTAMTSWHTSEMPYRTMW